MRKIITTTFVTMDGVMQAPGGPEEDTSGGFKYGGWQAKVMDDSLGEAINEFLKPPFGPAADAGELVPALYGGMLTAIQLAALLGLALYSRTALRLARSDRAA